MPRSLAKRLAKRYDFFINSKQQTRIGQTLVWLAITGFVLALLAWGSYRLGMPLFPEYFTPKTILAAVNVPFIILLIYKLFTLVVALPTSVVSFVQKQFEIVALILIQGLFKDFDKLAKSEVTLTSPIVGDVGLTIVGSLLLYLFIEILERMERKYATSELKKEPKRMTQVKKAFALLLTLFVFAVTLTELTQFAMASAGTFFYLAYLNQIFLAIIVVNVLLLLLAMLYLHTFTILFEYSAFIAASVLVFIALAQDITLKLVMVVAAIIFTILTLRLHGYTRENEPVS